MSEEGYSSQLNEQEENTEHNALLYEIKQLREAAILFRNMAGCYRSQALPEQKDLERANELSVLLDRQVFSQMKLQDFQFEELESTWFQQTPRGPFSFE